MRRNQVLQRSLTNVIFGIVSGAAFLHAQLPQLWPTFSKPASVLNVDILNTAASPDDLLAEKTLIGAYNQLQEPTRLYLSSNTDDPYWLRALTPLHIAVMNLRWNRSDPDGALKALLARFGNKISGYYVCDPVNIPETCNMATTLAGIHQAMVVNPDNLSILSASHIPLLSDLRTMVWIGSDAKLVHDKNINMIDNPDGKDGASGWKTGGDNSAQTIGNTTYRGNSALQWTITAGDAREAWIDFEPKASPGAFYCFSAQVAGRGRVLLDAWDGIEDNESKAVTLSIEFQTLQTCLQIPHSDMTNPVKLEIRAPDPRNGAAVYLINAAVVESAVAVESAAYRFISDTSSLVLAQDANELYNKRDYDIAAKMFTFNLTSTDPAQKELYSKILHHTAPDTPIMGYPMIERYERPDVKFLSGPGEGHFLSASARYDNGSVWASLPRPSTLSQQAQTAVKAKNGTVYVAFAASEGDNMTYVEHRMQSLWANSQFLGAVPMGWTIPPGAIAFSPAMLMHYFQTLPQSSELMSGPGGVGYATAMTGPDLAAFGAYTHQFMKAEDLSTVDSWQWTEGDLPAFAAAATVPHVVWRFPRAYEKIGNSVIDGQDVTYNDAPAKQLQAINMYVEKHFSANAPLFVETLFDAWHLSPDDALYIAQQLQLHSTHPYIFITPGEMALTEEAYYSSSGASFASTNSKAISGATLIAAFPQNLLLNGDSLSSGAGVSLGGWELATKRHREGLLATQLHGERLELMTVPKGISGAVAVKSNITVPLIGRYYLFSLKVAGAGVARLCINDGAEDNCGASLRLTATFRTIANMAQIKSVAKASVRLELEAPPGARGVVYFQFTGSNPSYWFYTHPGNGGAGTVSLSTTLYRNVPVFQFQIPANQRSDQWVANLPTVTTGETCNFSVDVAGTGQAYLEAYDGASTHRTATIALSGAFHTLSLSGIKIAGDGVVELRVGSPSSSSPATIYFRNASVTLASGITDFYSGLEKGQPALNWTNTADTETGGGGESNVRQAVMKLTVAAVSHGGSNAIEYGGAASGGGTTRAYLKAFSNQTPLHSTSRLSYWVFPQSSLGNEPEAGSADGRGTCVAIDIVFTDGTALRNSQVSDQYGNPLNPAGECGHLIAGQWNYVTADLSSLAGKTVKTIDIGYEEPGATGMYHGYVDDISLTH